MRRTVALLLLMLSQAFAGLELLEPVVEIRSKPEDETTETVFEFINRGPVAVRVLEVESACGCLKAELDKTVYLPGEKGRGLAEFTVTSFVGRHEKAVHVRTDDPAQPEWVIPFVLEVPEVVRIEPKTLQWQLGGPTQPQTARVSILGEEPMRITSITSTREKLKFHWREVVPGREYEVTLQPENTDEVLLGALKIEIASRIPKYRRQMAFFSVVRQPEGGSRP